MFFLYTHEVFDKVYSNINFDRNMWIVDVGTFFRCRLSKSNVLKVLLTEILLLRRHKINKTTTYEYLTLFRLYVQTKGRSRLQIFVIHFLLIIYHYLMLFGYYLATFDETRKLLCQFYSVFTLEINKMDEN